MRKDRGSPGSLCPPLPKKILNGPPHRRLRQFDGSDNPKPDWRLLVSGIGLGQLTTSFRGLVSEDRGSETIEFGVANSHDGVTRHKTEQGAFLTNMWPNLGGDDIWRPGATADDKYGLHREPTLSGVCSSCDNDYEIDLGLNSLGKRGQGSHNHRGLTSRRTTSTPSSHAISAVASLVAWPRSMPTWRPGTR
jgi:hypothetical protein